MDETSFAWLADHRAFNRVVVPGAFYGALAAALQNEAGIAVSLRDSRIHAPWLLPDSGGASRASFQIVLSGREPGASIEIYGRASADDSWRLIADARLARDKTPDRAPTVDLRSLTSGMRLVEPTDLYQALDRRGLQYGPAFRSVEELWRGSNSAVARLTLPSVLADSSWPIHPALLDGCLQTVAAASGASEDAMFMPVGWERFALAEVPLGEVVCHAKLGGDGSAGHGSDATIVADLVLYDENGARVGEMAGIVLRRATRAQIVSQSADGDFDRLYYEIGWKKRALPMSTSGADGEGDVDGVSGSADAADSAPNPEKVADEGTWLLAASTRRRASALAAALAARNRNVVLAVDADDPERSPDDDRTGDHDAIESCRTIALDQKSREAWRSLLDELAAHSPLGGVVFLTPADGPASPFDAALGTCERVLAISQALAGMGGRALSGADGQSPTGPNGPVARGLTLVTRGGQSLGGEREGRLDASAVWGFGRSLALEEPDLRVRLIDMDPAASPTLPSADHAADDDHATATDAQRLVAELLEPDDETQVCWRAGARYAARLLPGPALKRLEPPDDDWHLAAAEDGALANLTVETADPKPLQENEIRLHVEAAGLNFHDVLVAMRIVDAGAPLGDEACGRVVEIGPGVSDLEVGDRVVGFAAPAFAREAVARAEHVAKAPEGFAASALATLPSAFCTAADCLAMAGLAAGERVLIHAAAGEVGHAAIQLARNAGAEVWATASAGKREHVRSLGAVRVFDSRTTDFGQRILEATGGEGVDVVLNSLAGDGFVEASLSCLGEGGRFVEISKRDIWSAEKMTRVRPDVSYYTYALDELLKTDPQRIARVLGDVMDRVATGELAPLPHAVWSMGEAPRAMELMREGRHVGKLTLTAPPLHRGRLREDRSYLVTGGMGGLGLKVAGWLAERGAGTIVLCGRSEPGEQALAEIESLAARGATVAVERADVSDAEQVRALLDRIREERGELAGVVHCAGVLADASLDNQTPETFRQVFAPKVGGAWHLHRETLRLELDLDLFVLFSSMSGVTGTPGQTNYAAANAWLDELALHRRAMGLAAQSIAWGRWGEVGLAARLSSEDARLGGADVELLGTPMTPGEAIDAFDRVLRSGPAASVVADMEWQSVAAAVADVPFFADVLPARGKLDEADARARGDIMARLASARPAQRPQLLETLLKDEVAAVLELPEPPPSDVGFFDLGMDSLTAVELGSRLNKALAGAGSVGRTVAFDHPDVRSLTAHLVEILDLSELAAPPRAPSTTRVLLGDDPIAIVGMACRFPKADNLAAFRRLLERGDSGIDRIPRSRLGQYRTADALPPEAHFGGFIDGIDRFDAPFFGIAPVEANVMDPQQRLLLETTWEALEDAGIDPRALRGGPAGVYAGISTVDYRDIVAGAGGSGHFASAGTSPSVAIGRIAFTLDLEGPAIAVDTACSSSLVAMHQAVAALQRGEADVALAGGVNLVLLPDVTAGYADADMLTPGGRCKTFDASADGFVRGEGCGMVALKRLADAEADGDRIWALIKGSAVNHDGASAGLSVPSGRAQERVIRRALERGRVEPADVDYLEAHGTGTPLGDPIEVRSAAAVYGEGRDRDRPLLMGSVKTNVGHLEAAAGVAGVIKAVMSLRAPVLFRHLNFETPNPHIDWDAIPVKVTTEAASWPDANGRPRRAGVSSFGYSGTNAHMVLEGYGEPDRTEPRGVGVQPDLPDSWKCDPGPGAAPDVRVGGSAADAPASGRPERPQRLLVLSGRSERAVGQLAERYLAWLDETGLGDADERRRDFLADMAFTAAVGRSHFDHRAAVVFPGADGLAGADGATGASVPTGADELVSGLRRIAAGEGIAKTLRDPRIAFMFSPVGGQWPGMGRDLYDSEPVARDVLDRCAAVMDDLRGATEPPAATALLDVMFGAAGDLVDPAWNQPVLYALNSALVRLWDRAGIRPQAAIGHSFGEIVAAHAAGAYSLEDGMRLAALRGGLWVRPTRRAPWRPFSRPPPCWPRRWSNSRPCSWPPTTARIRW